MIKIKLERFFPRTEEDVCWMEGEQGRESLMVRSGKIAYRDCLGVDDRPVSREELINKAARALGIKPREARARFYQKGVLEWETKERPTVRARELGFYQKWDVDRRIEARRRREASRKRY